jgi:micrococcal nuclease
MYKYRAIITDVYDGDTVTANIDLGMQVWLHNVKLRILGVDAPEIRTTNLIEKAAAIQARDRVKDLILGKEVSIETKKKGKYGRWLVSIIIDKEDLSQILLKEGLVNVYPNKN